jgi:type IV secretory pathway component VirB8
MKEPRETLKDTSGSVRLERGQQVAQLHVRLAVAVAAAVVAVAVVVVVVLLVMMMMNIFPRHFNIQNIQSL